MMNEMRNEIMNEMINEMRNEMMNEMRKQLENDHDFWTEEMLLLKVLTYHGCLLPTLIHVDRHM